MEWIVKSFQQYPELAIFLTLALGYWVGRLKVGKFSLGAATGVLLAGVLVGQMRISISSNVQSLFFIMFLFAVGYGVGPQFVRGLKRDGLPQAVFAVLQCLASLVTAFAVAKFLGYNAGAAAGLLSGSQTVSTAIGVAADAIGQLDVTGEQRTVLLNHMAVAFAVTYLIGTASASWLLGSLGPKLLGVDLAAECKQLEAQLGTRETEPGIIPAARRFDVRTYRVTNKRLANQTVATLEDRLKDTRTSIERIRHGNRIADAESGTVIHLGDVVAAVGRREALTEPDLAIGPEVHDFELMDFPAEALDVVVTNKLVAGKTIRKIAQSDSGSAVFRGVYLRNLIRGGHEMPFSARTTIDRGDVLQIVGAKRNVERAAAELGYADRPTNATDMAFVGTGIVLGGLFGAATIRVGGIPLTLSTSGGALIAGLVCGWLRSVNATFGRVPGAALWVLNNLGFTTFLAVVGISAGPSFMAGLKAAGLSLLLAGIVASAVPLLVGLLMAKYLFRFHPAIALGVAAGARTATAALGVVQTAAQSNVPALGYTVPYAVGTILLTIWGLVIVHLMQ